MIERLTLKIGSDLIDWIELLIPKQEWISKDSTFHISDITTFEMVDAVAAILKKYGHDSENINKRITASTSSPLCLHYLKTEGICGYINYPEAFSNDKWDWIISIPKIERSKESNEFINTTLKKCKKGSLIMVSAKPLLDKLNKPQDKSIKSTFDLYLQKVVLIKPSVFGRDTIQTPLAFCSFKSFDSGIHFMEWIESKSSVKQISVYNTVTKKLETYNSIKDINLTFGNDDIAISIINKYQKYINEYGSMEDLVKNKGASTSNQSKYRFFIPAQRGHVASKNQNSFVKDDFYSMYSLNSVRGYGKLTTEQYPTKEDDTPVRRYNQICFSKKQEGLNIINYLNSKFAKFGFMWGKYDTTISPSTFRFIPKLDFTKPFNETDFQKLLGLTKKEVFCLKSNLVD